MPKPYKPWHPIAGYSTADVRAIRALWNGEATKDQQDRALQFIVVNMCSQTEMSFQSGPDGDRDTAFAEGRRFVGHEIARIAKLKIEMKEG